MLQAEHDMIMTWVLDKLHQADIATISMDAWTDSQVRSLYLGQVILPNRVAYVILSRDVSNEVQDAELLKGAVAMDVVLVDCLPLQLHGCTPSFCWPCTLQHLRLTMNLAIHAGLLKECVDRVGKAKVVAVITDNGHKGKERRLLVEMEGYEHIIPLR